MTAAYRPRWLSVSAVELYTRCPAAFHRRYVTKIADPPSAPMAFGRVMAKALEALHRGQDGELAFVQEYASQITAAGLERAPALQHGLALLARYRQRGVLAGEPEWRFELYLPDRDAVPVPILGFLDVATATEVGEFKTSAARWDQGRVDNSLQAHVYHWAYWQLRGVKPRAVRFLVMHTRQVALEEFVTTPSGGDLYLFQLQAAAVWRGIREGAYPPLCGQCPACVALVPAVAPKLEPTWDME